MMTKEIVELILGHEGKIITGSKSSYTRRHPKNLVSFNSNIIIEGLGKVWHGDIDITRSEALLIRLAEVLEREVYVLYEMDARFENEKNPKVQNALYKVNKTPFLNWYFYEGEVCMEFYERDKKSGLIQQKSKKKIDEILKKFKENSESVSI